jgi:hypothetical protein
MLHISVIFTFKVVHITFVYIEEGLKRLKTSSILAVLAEKWSSFIKHQLVGSFKKIIHSSVHEYE